MEADKERGEVAGRSARRLSTGEMVIIAGLLLLAAIVRLGWPGLTEFKADEGRLLTAALAMSGGQFTAHGISSSVGFPNAPMSVWLYALPLVFWRHPYAATLFTGILSVMTVVGVYWLGRRYWGATAAIAGSLMLAVSPWAIVFSRKIWAQNLLSVFAVGWAIAAALAFVEGRRRFIPVHLVCLAVAVQLHPAAIGLAPATLLFLIVFRRRIDWPMVVLGGALALLTAVPYLWYLWGRWQVEGGLPFATGQAAAQISVDSLRLTLSIIAGEGLRPLAGGSYTGLPSEVIVRLLWLAFIIIAVGWAVFQVVRRWKQPATQVLLICLAWFLAPALFFVWHRTPVYIHYFIVALPAPYLIAGTFFDQLVGQIRSQAKAFAWIALVVIAGLQLAAWGSLMTAIARDPLAGGFGIPLGDKLAAADGARRMLDEMGAAEVLVVGKGSDPEHDDFPAEFRPLLDGLPVRYVDLNREAVFPAAAAIALLDTAMSDGPTSVRELYEAVPGTRESFGVSEGSAYSVRSLPPAAQPPADVELPEPPLLANFVRLIGHNAIHFTGTEPLWDVTWRPADNPDPADYHFFNHLIDGTGARVAQTDVAAFAGSQWRAGDVVISRFLLPLSTRPQPPLTMRVGMYRFPTLESVPVLDEAANPVSDAVAFQLNE